MHTYIKNSVRDHNKKVIHQYKVVFDRSTLHIIDVTDERSDLQAELDAMRFVNYLNGGTGKVIKSRKYNHDERM